MLIVASGDYWTLDDNGLLSIFCVGDMPDYETDPPWYSNRDSILAISVSNNVTSIGNFAFSHCESLTSVTIPDSVTSIGTSAFWACRNLTSVMIPESVSYIGDGAFGLCDQLKNITIPDGIDYIGRNTFLCESLTSVTIPASVTIIGEGAFSGCESLTDVYYTGTEAQWSGIYIDDYNSDLTSATIHYNYVPTPPPVYTPIPAPEITVGSVGNPLAAVVRAYNQLVRAFLQLRERLANVPADATNNAGTITGITMNGVSKGTSGVVDLGTVLTEHQSLANYATTASVNLKADASTVNTLIGSDANMSVRAIANAELAAQLIPANAQASLDTLQEIAAWIQAHPADAAAINAKLTLGTNNGVEYATVKAYVEAMVSGLITLSALSAAVSGNGNAVTGVSYNNATGAFSFTKGATFLTEHQDISGKVDKVSGKGLSTEDYTTAEKTKLAGIAANATANVPATAAPLMDGTAAVGTSAKYAREDHRHGTDTSRAAAADVAALEADVSALQTENALLRELIEGIDAPLYRTATGNPAIFQDGYAANVRKLAVTLTPTQSGSGDPYPPGGGKNLLGVSLDAVKSNMSSATWNGNACQKNGVTATFHTGEGGWITTVSVSGTATASAFFQCPLSASSFPAGDYVLSSNVAGSGFSSWLLYLERGAASDKYATGDGSVAFSESDVWSKTYLTIAVYANKTINATFYPMLRRSGTDASFAPYANIRPISGVSSVSVAACNAPSNIVTITPAQSGSGDPSPTNVRSISGVNCGQAGTVYYGTLNITTGGLTVTHALITLTGAETTGTVGNNGNTITVTHGANYVGPDTAYTETPNVVCSHYPAVERSTLIGTPNLLGVCLFGSRSEKFIFSSVSGVSPAAFAQFLADQYAAGTPVQVVAPLKTPVTHTLTPVETKSVLNQLGYDGNRVTVSLVDSNSDPLTVYGGTLDVTAGTLTVTHKRVALSALNWGGVAFASDDYNPARIYFTPNVADMWLSPTKIGVRYYGEGVSNCFDFLYGGQISDSVPGKFSLWYDTSYSGYRLFVSAPNCANSTEFNQFVTDIGAEVVYRLATPVTYNLTAQSLAALSGYNAVSADAETLEVEYRADVKLSR